jgi:cell division protein FtsB
MARKAKPHDEELPFVALMDTMTNVVGVLIIVLVMIGIGLAKSVKKVLSELPLVSEEEHVKLKEELAKIDTSRDPAEVAAETPKLQKELEKVLETLTEAEAAQAKNPIVLEDLDKLLKQIDSLRKERDQRKLTVTELLAEIDKLKIKLDTTPPYVPPPGIAVRLPNPKPMPEQAELQRVLVSEGKLVFLREKDFAKAVEEALKNGDSADYITRRETVKGPDGKVLMKKGSTGQPAPVRKLTFDPTKMSNFFARANVGNRDVKVEVIQRPNSANIQLNVLPKPNGGETVEQARKMSSAFRSQLHALKTNPKAVVWFHVCKDSIPAYLGARDLVDLDGIPVGWEMWDKPSFTHPISPEFLVEYTPPPPPPGTPPPPPGTPPKPAGPPPVVIAAPKATVD